jgi:hypothetical protein
MAAKANTLENMVSRQVGEVLRRGQRYERFDQLRSRHFWSSYLFVYGAGNPIAAGQYDIFKIIPSQSGQGYPANVPLTLRETNWLNGGRVPDNQNFVITEIGATVQGIPATSIDSDGGIVNAPTDGIYANLPAGLLAGISPFGALSPFDAYSLLNGIVLEMSFLTNSVPLGYLGDFSQSGGSYAPSDFMAISGQLTGALPQPQSSNGIPAAAFRRKLEVPILLQHGEAMGMRLNIHRDIPTIDLESGGSGIAEVRIDWWAHESFTEKS